MSDIKDPSPSGISEAQAYENRSFTKDISNLDKKVIDIDKKVWNLARLVYIGYGIVICAMSFIGFKSYSSQDEIENKLDKIINLMEQNSRQVETKDD